MKISIEAQDKLIFVNIKHSYEAMINHDTASEYYRKSLKECTRKYWKVRKEAADSATHILGCYQGIVKEVIKMTSYHISEDKYPGRKIFEGEVQRHSPYIGMDIRELFGNLANFIVKYYNL